MVGRPTVMTESRLEKLRQAFLLGCSDEQACSSAGIHVDTLYRYQRINKGFSSEKELLKSNIGYRAKVVRADLLENGDEQTKYKISKDIIEHLEGKAKERVEHSGKIEGSTTLDETLRLLAEVRSKE